MNRDSARRSVPASLDGGVVVSVVLFIATMLSCVEEYGCGGGRHDDNLELSVVVVLT